MNTKLKKWGLIILWFFGAVTLLAQAYRAAMYYFFDKPIDWLWVDAIVSVVAFAFMFIPNEVKTAVSKVLKKKTDEL